MVKFEKKKCIVCEKEFDRITAVSRRPRHRSYRKSTAITCSHRCSRIYMRIYRRIKEGIEK